MNSIKCQIALQIKSNMFVNKCLTLCIKVIINFCKKQPVFNVSKHASFDKNDNVVQRNEEIIGEITF